MGKITGFLEFERQGPSKEKAPERLKHWREFERATPEEQLKIQGARRAPSNDEVRRLHRMEIAFGRFERTIRIAIPFERERVNASLEDGFLTVTLPKREALRRRIEVEAGGEEETSR